jgi:hypothetical protein
MPQRQMWKLPALVFFGLTLMPGLLVAAGILITGRIDGISAGEIGALAWLIVVAVIFWCGVSSGMDEARRVIRRERNQCVKCGYDLRDSAGRCPECGSEVDARMH